MAELASPGTPHIDAPEAPSGREVVATWLIIFATTFGSLAFFYTRGLTNLYGDGLAHMEGARRIFDSLTPGYPEIGTVWLPLYHVLVAPLAANDHLWRTGLGGSLLSTAALAIAAWFVFRLSLEMSHSKAAAVVGLAVFLICPSMLYLASMPLTEPLALLWYVVAVYGLFRFQQAGRMRSLVLGAAAAFFGTLTRYDGWYLLPFATVFVFLVRRAPWLIRLRHAVVFAVISGMGPLLWFVHNAYRFGNPLEFYNGPDSAQAIYAHQVATTAFRYPTDGSLVLAARYYLADLVVVIGVWPLALALLGLAAWAADRRNRTGRSAALLLLVPFVFYVNSLAYGGAAVYVPTLFPHTYLDLRYGLEMLPAVAVFSSFLLPSALPRMQRLAVLAGVLIILLGQTTKMLSRGVDEVPLVKESLINTPCRLVRQEVLIPLLRAQYDGQMVLSSKGRWPCLMVKVTIPFRNTVSELDKEYRVRLRSKPHQVVGWIIRGDDDGVDQLMRAYPQAFEHFQLVQKIEVRGEGSVALYRRRIP
jgi:hypothetical protein